MTREQILAENFHFIHKFASVTAKGSPHKDDLIQEVALIMSSMNESKLVSLHEKGELNLYTIGTIFRSFKSNTSPFYRKIRKFGANKQESLCVSDRSEQYWFGQSESCKYVEYDSTYSKLEKLFNWIGENMTTKECETFVSYYYAGGIAQYHRELSKTQSISLTRVGEEIRRIKQIIKNNYVYEPYSCFSDIV